MTRTFPFIIVIVVHLLALLALGGFVHGIEHVDSESTCPIPLAMGVDCGSASDEWHSFAHVFSSIDYVISLLSVSLAPLFALIIIFVVYTFKRSNGKHGVHAPPLAWGRHFLSVLVVRFRRFRRWMAIMRSDTPLIITRLTQSAHFIVATSVCFPPYYLRHCHEITCSSSLRFMPDLPE